MDYPALRSEKGGANTLRSLSPFEKYKKYWWHKMKEEPKNGVFLK